MGLACPIHHTLETDCASSFKSSRGEGGARVVFHIDAEPGKPVTLTKFITYHTSRTGKTDELVTARTKLDRVVRHGFGQLSRISGVRRRFLEA